MRKNDIKKSFDKVEPDDLATNKMLNNVLSYSNKKEQSSFRSVNSMRKINIKRAIPVLALVLVVTGSLVAYNLIPKNNDAQTSELAGNAKNNNTSEVGTDAGAKAEVGRDAGAKTKDDASSEAKDNASAEAKDDIGNTEGMILPITNQFRIDNKHYIIMSDEMKQEFDFSCEISSGDVGEKIAVISDTPDESLNGCEVYSYVPAGGNAVVVVKQNAEYKLFKFLNFESYNNNRDEDAIEYLKLYGINSAADISKIQFIGYSEQSKLEGKVDLRGEIKDQKEIEAFYNYYSIMKDSSEKYFNKLFNYIGVVPEDKTDIKADDFDIPDEIVALYQDVFSEQQAIGGTESEVYYVDNDFDRPEIASEPVDMIDPDNTSSGSTEPSQGSAGEALSGQVTIRIYSKSGVYFNAEYYPNMGFISRHEVGEGFAQFLDKYIG